MSETADIVVKRAAIQKEIANARLLLDETLAELAMTNKELSATLESIDAARRTRQDIEAKLDELDREAPLLAAKKSASTQRLEDLRRRYEEEVSALTGDNETLRNRKREFMEAMDDMQTPLVAALTMRFADKLKKRR